MTASTNLALVPSTDIAAVLPGQEVADENLVKEVIAEINDAYKQGSVGTMQRVGKILLHRMFGDDMANFATQADKHKSFKALAKSKSLEFSSSHLWYAVALQSPEKVLGESYNQLSDSVQRRLVHVPDDARRVELAQRAATERLSVKAVEALIKAGNTKSDGRGRPALPAAVKLFSKISGAADKLGADTWKITQAEPLKAATAADILKQVKELREALDTWLPQFEAELTRTVQAEQTSAD